MKLTKPQFATLAYVAMKCEINIYAPRTGTLPTKNLVKLGLLRVQDSSWGECKILTYTPTAKGHAFIKDHPDRWRVLNELGWL